jgi:molecular chaperone DnaK
MEAEINQPFITQGPNGPLHLTMKITRAKLEELTADLIKKSMEPVKKCLTDAGVKAGEIDEIVLVGGQTRMPAVQKAVKDFFGKEPHKGVNPDEVAQLCRDPSRYLGGEVTTFLLDVTPSPSVSRLWEPCALP